MGEVSFYQLSRDPVERVVPLLAAKALEAGARVLVVSDFAAQRSALSDALWAREGAFLANGADDEVHAARQPIIVGADCVAPNGARTAILADGNWRDEASQFERVLLLFAPEQTGAARSLWGKLAGAGESLRVFKQDEAGRWREGR